MKDEKIHNKPSLIQLRKNLRSNCTKEEAIMWTYLKNKRLNGVKFRRQHSIGNYVVDFYSPGAMLVIELDGANHFTKEGKAIDAERDLYLKSLGLKVLRFENKLVLDEIDNVLESIKSELDN